MSRFVIKAGWDHAPHLDETAMKTIRDSTPPHLIRARSEGDPTLGAGSVFPVPEREITIYPDSNNPFELKPHWRLCYGLDLGWNCTAAAFLAYDPNADVVYLYDCYKASRKELELHAAHIKYRFPKDPPMIIPGAVDPKSATASALDDGRKLIKLLRDNGLKLVEAENNVETFINEMWSRLTSSRFKVVHNSNTAEWTKEYLKYRFDDHGKIVKKDDHAMDATKYGLLTGLKVAKSPEMARIGRPMITGARNYGI